MFRSSHPEVFLGKGKYAEKFTGKHSRRSVISIKLQSNFIETTLGYGGSPVKLLQIFRITFTKNTCGRLFLNVTSSNCFLICPPNLVSLTSSQTQKYQGDFKHFIMPSKFILSIDH